MTPPRLARASELTAVASEDAVTASRDALRARLDAEMKEFTAKGGVVAEVPQGATGHMDVIRMTRADTKRHHRALMDYFFVKNADKKRDTRGRYAQ